LFLQRLGKNLLEKCNEAARSEPISIRGREKKREEK